MEVHEDIYGKFKDLESHARSVAKKMGVETYVDWEKAHMALHEKSGVPVPVGALPKGGEGEEPQHRRAGGSCIAARPEDLVGQF